MSHIKEYRMEKDPKPDVDLGEVWAWVLGTIAIFAFLFLWAALFGGDSKGDAAYCEQEEGYMGQNVTVCHGE